MKKKSIFCITAIALVCGALFSSCDKCKACYLIEEVDGTETRHYQGEYCGDDIQKQESLVFYPSEGTAQIECE